MNKQREVIYADRRQIIAGEALRDRILDMIAEEFDGDRRRPLAGGARGGAGPGRRSCKRGGPHPAARQPART